MITRRKKKGLEDILTSFRRNTFRQFWSAVFQKWTNENLASPSCAQIIRRNAIHILSRIFAWRILPKYFWEFTPLNWSVGQNGKIKTIRRSRQRERQNGCTQTWEDNDIRFSILDTCWLALVVLRYERAEGRSPVLRVLSCFNILPAEHSRILTCYNNPARQAMLQSLSSGGHDRPISPALSCLSVWAAVCVRVWGSTFDSYRLSSPPSPWPPLGWRSTLRKKWQYVVQHDVFGTSPGQRYPWTAMTIAMSDQHSSFKIPIILSVLVILCVFCFWSVRFIFLYFFNLAGEA